MPTYAEIEDQTHTVSVGAFTDWARDQRNDLTGLQADIELERFGTDPTSQIYERVTELVEDSIRMVEVAILNDETIGDAIDSTEVQDTFLTRIERVVRDLYWSDPDGDIVRDLEDAVRGLADGEEVVFA